MWREPWLPGRPVRRRAGDWAVMDSLRRWLARPVDDRLRNEPPGGYYKWGA